MLDELRDNIEKELQKDDMTIPQICKKLDIDDEFDVLSCIGDLECLGKISFKGFDKFYQPDGCAGYLAKYGCVNQ